MVYWITGKSSSPKKEWRTWSWRNDVRRINYYFRTKYKYRGRW